MHLQSCLTRWFLAFTFCMCFAGATHALDWRRVGAKTADGTSLYLDVDSLRKQPDGVYTVSILFDQATVQQAPNGAQYLSEARTVRIDCKGERLADQSIVKFAGHALKGTVVQRMERSANEANAAMEVATGQSSGQALVWAVCEFAVRGRPAGQ